MKYIEEVEEIKPLKRTPTKYIEVDEETVPLINPEKKALAKIDQSSLKKSEERLNKLT